MSKVIVLPGTVIGRAHANFPVTQEGKPDPQEFTEDVTLTIQPTTTAIQSGEFKVLCDELHEEDFLRDSAVELILAPAGWKAATDEGNDVQALLQANAALSKSADKATEELKARGDQITSLQSQLGVMTTRAETAEGAVTRKDGEITVLKAELARLQNAMATAPAPQVSATDMGTTGILAEVKVTPIDKK